ncbi:MAG: AAA family ATPase [Methylococcaceae bacterium]
MFLKHVKIQNYRSIKKIEFDFDPTCKILEGINESGKSNLLQALAHLDPDRKISANDLREVGKDEDADPQGEISFRFEFEPLELAQVTLAIAKKVLGSVAHGRAIAKFRNQKHDLGSFVRSRKAVLWDVSINDEKRALDTTLWGKGGNYPSRLKRLFWMPLSLSGSPCRFLTM